MRFIVVVAMSSSSLFIDISFVIFDMFSIGPVHNQSTILCQAYVCKSPILRQYGDHA